jgi:hypothetical protein
MQKVVLTVAPTLASTDSTTRVSATQLWIDGDSRRTVFVSPLRRKTATTNIVMFMMYVLSRGLVGAAGLEPAAKPL